MIPPPLARFTAAATPASFSNNHRSSLSALWLGAVAIAACPSLQAAPVVTQGHGGPDAAFSLAPVPPPAINDAAAKATFSLVDGSRDGSSGELAVLADGKLPATEDSPAANFFFADNTDGGRIGVDLGSIISVKSIGSYSWHGGGRGPQVYTLFAADGKAEHFNAAPKRGTDPASCGWQRVAAVDTRPHDGKAGGQYAVEISNKDGAPLGEFRHLLFDVAKAAAADPFGNTFFSEIDVIDAKGPAVERLKPALPLVTNHVSADGKASYSIDSSKAPDLTEWSEKELLPVIVDWYPKLVALLPSEGFHAATVLKFEFRTDMGGVPAYTAGNKISLNAPWIAGQLKGEAKGCVIHEMVHVVQGYGRGPRGAKPAFAPGWVTEGLADYVRWYLYEPQSKGTVIRDPKQAKYDASYRVTANFFDWVVTTQDKDLLRKLNTAGREARYSEDLWKTWTGKTLAQLGEEWKKAIADGRR
ncbi:MAG: basic secretory protein-like protein [Verrucomicrobiota bacterium]